MPYIEFTRTRQVMQVQRVMWGEAEWEAFKLRIKNEAEEYRKEYLINLHEAIKDMSFDFAMKEYNTWRCTKTSSVIVKGYNAPLGVLIHEALSDAASEVEPQEVSISDSSEYVEFIN